MKTLVPDIYRTLVYPFWKNDMKQVKLGVSYSIPEGGLIKFDVGYEIGVEYLYVPYYLRKTVSFSLVRKGRKWSLEINLATPSQFELKLEFCSTSFQGEILSTWYPKQSLKFNGTIGKYFEFNLEISYNVNFAVHGIFDQARNNASLAFTSAFTPILNFDVQVDLLEHNPSKHEINIIMSTNEHKPTNGLRIWIEDNDGDTDGSNRVKNVDAMVEDLQAAVPRYLYQRICWSLSQSGSLNIEKLTYSIKLDIPRDGLFKFSTSYEIIELDHSYGIAFTAALYKKASKWHTEFSIKRTGNSTDVPFEFSMESCSKCFKGRITNTYGFEEMNWDFEGSLIPGEAVNVNIKHKSLGIAAKIEGVKDIDYIGFDVTLSQNNTRNGRAKHFFFVLTTDLLLDLSGGSMKIIMKMPNWEAERDILDLQLESNIDNETEETNYDIAVQNHYYPYFN